MDKQKHLYCFSYDKTESDLCKLESKCIFGEKEKDKLLFSDITIEPSSSAFIKRRLDIILFSDDYATLLDRLKREQISAEGFKIEYLVCKGDRTEYSERLKKLKDIGYSIEGTPDYHKPSITYVLCHTAGIWYFASKVKNSFSWYKHKKKPKSFSNSININIAKALVNIATKANNEKKILDACCGVGTIMLEACFSNVSIEGCDINWKVCRDARENLAHFAYVANVYRSDIKDISCRYDAAIIDLPYNLFSCATDSDLLHIIASAAEITDRLIVVSVTDITHLVSEIGFVISDHCSVSKRGKTNFARRIWVCEKEG